MICEACSTVSERLGARIAACFESVTDGEYGAVSVNFSGLSGPEKCAGAFFVGAFRKWLMQSWDETIWS